MSSCDSCTPAILNEAHAVWYQKGSEMSLLIIHAEGTVNNQCWNLTILESKVPIWPPLFHLCKDRRQLCEPYSEAPVKRSACGYFYFYAEAPKFVYLSHKGGIKEVPVLVNGECECTAYNQLNRLESSDNPDIRRGISHVSRSQAFNNARYAFAPGKKDQAEIPMLITEVVDEGGGLENGRPYYTITLKRIHL